MQFSDLVGLSDRPDQAEPAIRRPIAASPPPVLSDDLRNNGFAASVLDERRSARTGASRRTFLRSTLLAAAATTAASMVSVFGPARRVAAQTGVVGSYPRRLLTFCPPYNVNDNCQPGCGSSPICTDCCSSDGFFRNDPANGYSLYAGGCGDGDIADGWIWRYNDTCGSCASIEYRCSDGYVQTDTGPAPFICRAVTECVPLPDGAEANNQPDLAVQTNWSPAGALEQAVDNGGSVSLTGWIADADGLPVDLRVTANNQIVHIGKASLARPDIAAAVRGAGPNTGYAITFPIEPGPYQLCINALKGAISVTIGCVNLDVGTGQVVRGGSTSTTIGGLAEEPPPTTATPEPTSGATGATPDTGAPDSDASAADDDAAPPTDGRATLVPLLDTPTASPTRGAAQIIRRSDTSTGFASGWAGDPDSDQPPWIDVVVDGFSTATMRPDLPRPDVAAALSLGPDTGFAGSFPLPEREVEVCVEMVDPDDGRRWSLGCRRLGAAIDADPPEIDFDDPATGRPTAEGDPIAIPDVVWGGVDSVELDGTDIVVRGWALAPNERARAVELRVVLAGLPTTGTTGLDHPGARARFGFDEPCGFELRVPSISGEQTIRVEAATLQGSTLIGEATITVP